MTQELSAAQRRGRIQSAHYLLKQARALLAPDIAPQALKRVRAAIKSTEGALRHAECMETRDAELDARIDAEEARKRAEGPLLRPYTLDCGNLDDCWD